MHPLGKRISFWRDKQGFDNSCNDRWSIGEFLNEPFWQPEFDSKWGPHCNFWRMSYKGGSSYNNSFTNDSVWVDKAGIVHYNGDPRFAEEFEERVWLGFQSMTKGDQATYAAKLKNALSGRAWTLCHRKAEISAEKLLTLSESEPSSSSGPRVATKLVVKTVRAAVERVAPLLKSQAFEDYFFEKGRRRPGEQISDFIQRRQNEYERLQSLTQGHTKLSVDLQAFFLLRNSGASAGQQRSILGQAGNEYDWDKIVEAMTIQLDAEITGDAKMAWKGNRKGQPMSKGYASSSQGSSMQRRTWAFTAEDEDGVWTEDYDGGGEENYHEEDVWIADDGDDNVLDDLDEMEHAIEVMAVEEMTQEELDCFAAETQRLTRSVSDYAKKRRMVQQGKTNRGFQQSSNFNHNKSSVSLDGKLTLSGKELQEKMSEVKKRTRCFACNQFGHWEGDAACPKSGGNKGKGKYSKGRKGGFLQRAGMAAVLLAGATGHVLCPELQSGFEIQHYETENNVTDVFMVNKSNQLPTSVDSFATSGKTVVPPGYAVVDTAALLGCAGDGAIDEFIKTFSVDDNRESRKVTFKGVNSSAPTVSKELQWLSIGLNGRSAKIALHRLPDSQVPILLGLPQLKSLGAIIDLENVNGPSITFKKVGYVSIPLEYSSNGHLMLNIAKWKEHNKPLARPLIGETIEMFPADGVAMKEEKKIMRRKERLKVEKMAEACEEQGKAIWKELRRHQEKERPNIVKEIYCGRGGGAVTIAASSLGISTGKPVDLVLGDNVLNPNTQREILQQLDGEDPYLVIVAFPCDPWSPLSNFKDADRKEWEQSEAFRHLQFVKRICFSQLRRGRHYLLENPLSSQAWKWLVWLNQIPNHSATMHQCQTKLKDHNGDFILKPTRFVTSSPMLALILALKCDRSHEHAAVQGRGQGISSSLAEWTPFLAKLILRGLKQQMMLEEKFGSPTYEMEENLVFHNEEMEVEAYPSDLRRSAEVVFKENAELAFDEWHEVPPALRSAIVKLHKQYSHALSGESLVGHLRLGGASSSAIKAASLYKCETCEREVKNLPRPVAAVPRYDKFNECVALDICFLPCMKDVFHAFLVMVDSATHFTVASYLTSGERPGKTVKPTSDQAAKGMLDWIEMFGRPTKVQLDQDSAFRGALRNVLDNFQIEDVMVARDAHWSHGLVERRILMLKEMLVKVVKDFQAQSPLMMRIAVTQCAHTINRMANNHGFSPAQCVLGVNPQLPDALSGAGEHPGMMNDPNFSMMKRLELQQSCEQSFVKASHNSALRRSLLAQVRRQPGPFEMHSVVMYKRLGGAKSALHHRWHGPARVIGKDIHGYWLVHRGVAVLAHPNNMRRAVEDEILESSEAWPKDNLPEGQRGFLDLSKEIPPESLEDDSIWDMRHGQQEDQEEPLWNMDEEPPIIVDGPEQLPEPQELPEELRAHAESSHDGWVVRNGLGPVLLRTKEMNFQTPEPTFPDYNLRTTWLCKDECWRLLEQDVDWSNMLNAQKVLPMVADRLLVVFSQGQPQAGDGASGPGDDGNDNDDDDGQYAPSSGDNKEKTPMKPPRTSRSARRRKRRKKAKESENPLDVSEHVEENQHSFEEQMNHEDDAEARKRKALDDVPLSIRQGLQDSELNKVARHDSDDDVGEAKEHERKEVSESDYTIWAFLADRLEDSYIKNTKHKEYHPNRIKYELPEWPEKEINEAMQRAVEKEMATWMKFDAVEVIPPEEAKIILEKEPEKVISSRGVWTKKDTEEVNGKMPLELKCRIVGRGFQEMYDEKLRRDSPTCSQLLVNLICSMAASRSMKLSAADVRGAFLQGLKIERDLYFKLPANMGQTTIPDVRPGSLLKLKKSIYGVNDAARQWYQSFKSILLEQGWKPLTFENAGFIFRDETSQSVVAIMALHVDDVLMAMDFSKFPELCKQLEDGLKQSVEWGSWKECEKERVKFCGRCYKQSADYTIEIDCMDYVASMSDYKVGRDRMKMKEDGLTAAEMKAFRGLLGQLQWFSRIGGYEVNFGVSQLASKMSSPRVEDLAEASRLIRMVKSEHNEKKMIFRPGLKFSEEDIAVVAVHDASFANVGNHGSQRGCWLGITTKNLLEDHNNMHTVHFLQWNSGRIHRVVRSTLSAEAYSCSEALDSLNWMRATLKEILHGGSMKDYNDGMQTLPGVTVTDCKSLYDCIHSERTLLSDKRLSLEAAIIRQSLDENLSIRWVSTEQQLADCLTKTLSKKGLWYVNEVMDSNLWTLGPDTRVKIKRDLVRERNQEKVKDMAESNDLNKKHSGYVKETKGGTMTAKSVMALTLACEMGEVRGEKMDIALQDVRSNWVMMVCFTAIILIASLGAWYKFIWKPGLKIIPYRRLMEFEKYAMVAGATWLGTSVCFAVEETLLFSNLQWFHRWHFATTVIPICAMLGVCGLWIWKHVEMILLREACINNSTMRGIVNEIEQKHDQLHKTMNNFRQEVTLHRQSVTDTIHQMQLTLHQLELHLRDHEGQMMMVSHEIRAMTMARTEEIQDMMRPLLPTTRREQVVLHAEDETPVHSEESTGSWSSTRQIIARQHQIAGLRRELEEALEGDDVERQTDLANMLDQLEMEVDAEREQRRAMNR